MAWLGMSGDTLPGEAIKPPPRHPGARNIEREKQKQSVQSPPNKPEEKPTTKPKSTEKPIKKNNNKGK